MYLDNVNMPELEPAPTKGQKEVIEAESTKKESTPSLLYYLLGGAVLGYLALKI